MVGIPNPKDYDSSYYDLYEQKTLVGLANTKDDHHDASYYDQHDP